MLEYYFSVADVAILQPLSLISRGLLTSRLLMKIIHFPLLSLAGPLLTKSGFFHRYRNSMLPNSIGFVQEQSYTIPTKRCYGASKLIYS